MGSMPKNPPAHAPGPAERPRPVLDEVDRAIVAELLRDGRAPNVVLARAAGVAESTCLARVRSLRERGIVTGVTADVDLGRLGLPVQAMVAIRFAGIVNFNAQSILFAQIKRPIRPIICSQEVLFLLHCPI